jgi:hypothetical protein
MNKIGLALLACLGAAACTPTTTGTVAGATTGAIVGGPVGAVVGGGIGAAAGNVSGAQSPNAGPRTCYRYDRNGNLLLDSAGNPRLRRC